jgi:hypothetical protein
MEVLKLIGIFLLLNVMIYLIGSFIAWDLNPLNWWTFKDTFGRILFLFMESAAFTSALKIND